MSCQRMRVVLEREYFVEKGEMDRNVCYIPRGKVRGSYKCVACCNSLGTFFMPPPE